MTSVSSNLSLLSYISSISKSEDSSKPATGTTPATTPSTGTGTGTNTGTGSSTADTTDPIAELRKYAAGIVAQSRGGLFKALAGGEQTLSLIHI